MVIQMAPFRFCPAHDGDGNDGGMPRGHAELAWEWMSAGRVLLARRPSSIGDLGMFVKDQTAFSHRVVAIDAWCDMLMCLDPGWRSVMPKHTSDLLFDKLRPTRGPASTQAPVRRSDAGPPPPAVEAPPRPVARPPRAETSSKIGQASSDASSAVSFENGRLMLSLTSTAAGIAAFALVMLLALVFWSGSSWGEHRGKELGFKQGRESYSKDAIDEIEQARAQQPNQDIVSELLTNSEVKSGTGDAKSAASSRPGDTGKGTESGKPADGGKSTEADARKVAWVEGYNYIVAQQFDVSALDDARAAQQFLLDNQVPTAIVRVKDGYRLITIEGFNFKEPTQRQRADLLKKRIAGIGQRYAAAGGRYKLEGYFAAYKGGW